MHEPNSVPSVLENESIVQTPQPNEVCDTTSVSDPEVLRLWCVTAIGLASAVLTLRGAYVGVVVRDKSAAEVCVLYVGSLPYITLWAMLSFPSVMFLFYVEPSEGIEALSVLVSEFVVISQWSTYFENSDFIVQYVKENQERLRCLLEGELGLDEITLESLGKEIEKAVVEFLRQQLGRRKWTHLGNKEMGTLLFDSGILTAQVILNKLGEERHCDVAAFMSRWVNLDRAYDVRVRVPERARNEMEGRELKTQALYCVAIILANETPDIRRRRGQDSLRCQVPYISVARQVACKAAAEGILSWPNCLFRSGNINVDGPRYSTQRLYIRRGHEEECCCEDRIPQCVKHSLTEMIKAGYFEVSQKGKININVAFERSRMIIKNAVWNQRAAMEHNPFRYITSVRWKDNELRFGVEERDNKAAGLDGSASLEGILGVDASVQKEEEMTWMQDADLRDSDAGIWGNVGDFIKPRAVCVVNVPMLWIIRSVWFVVDCLLSLSACLVRLHERLNAAVMHWRFGTDLGIPAANVAFLQSTDV